MSLLPAIIPNGDGLPTRQLVRASRAQQRAELVVYEHNLAAHARSMCDQIDSQATGDAFRVALDEEVGLLDYGLRKANGSPAKAELIARKVERFSSINDNRLSRRFAG